MRPENEECGIESYPDERCAHGQTDRQRHVHPVSLRRRINEIRDDPWRRFKARPPEHRLCHRCRIILRHIERVGDIAALLVGRGGITAIHICDSNDRARSRCGVC